MDLLFKIISQETGVVWYPLVLIAILLLLLAVISLWGRTFFNNTYRKDTALNKPFNSGNADDLRYNIKSNNLYWGFKKAFEIYYEKMEKIHSGDLNDYIKWLVITVAVSLLLLCGGII